MLLNKFHTFLSACIKSLQHVHFCGLTLLENKNHAILLSWEIIDILNYRLSGKVIPSIDFVVISRQ